MKNITPSISPAGWGIAGALGTLILLTVFSINREHGKEVAQERSSTVYLAYATDLVKVESLGIRVTDKGFVAIDPAAKAVRVATEWDDLEGFKQLLVKRLIH